VSLIPGVYHPSGLCVLGDNSEGGVGDSVPVLAKYAADAAIRSS
jgi:hypothetical protein